MSFVVNKMKNQEHAKSVHIKPKLVTRCTQTQIYKRTKLEHTKLNVTGEYVGKVTDSDRYTYDISIMVHQAGYQIIGYYAAFNQRYGSLVDDGLWHFEGLLKKQFSSGTHYTIVFNCSLWKVALGSWDKVSGTVEHNRLLTIKSGGAAGTRLSMPDLEKGNFLRSSTEPLLPFEKLLQLVPQRQWWRLCKGGSFPSRIEADKVIAVIKQYMRRYPNSVRSDRRGQATIFTKVFPTISKFYARFDGKTFDNDEWWLARGYIRSQLQAIPHHSYGNCLDFLPNFLNDTTFYRKHVQAVLGIPRPTGTWYAYRWRMQIINEDPSSKVRDRFEKWRERLKKAKAIGKAFGQLVRRIMRFIPLRVTGRFEIRKYEANSPTGFNWEENVPTWTYNMQLFIWELTDFNSFFEEGDTKWGKTSNSKNPIPRNTVISSESWTPAQFNNKGIIGTIIGSFQLVGGGSGKPKWNLLRINFIAPSGYTDLSGAAELFKSNVKLGGFLARGDLFYLGNEGSKVSSPFRGYRREIDTTKRKKLTIFEYAKSVITPEGHNQIRDFCANNLPELSGKPSYIRIYGYASYEKDNLADSDMKLSKARACAVLRKINDFLGSRTLVVGLNTEVGGFGHIHAKQDKRDPAAQSDWRRVDIILNGRHATSFYGQGTL